MQDLAHIAMHGDPFIDEEVWPTKRQEGEAPGVNVRHALMCVLSWSFVLSRLFDVWLVEKGTVVAPVT